MFTYFSYFPQRLMCTHKLGLKAFESWIQLECSQLSWRHNKVCRVNTLRFRIFSKIQFNHSFSSKNEYGYLPTMITQRLQLVQKIIKAYP